MYISSNIRIFLCNFVKYDIYTAHACIVHPCPQFLSPLPASQSLPTQEKELCSLPFSPLLPLSLYPFSLSSPPSISLLFIALSLSFTLFHSWPSSLSLFLSVSLSISSCLSVYLSICLCLSLFMSFSLVHSFSVSPSLSPFFLFSCLPSFFFTF